MKWEVTITLKPSMYTKTAKEQFEYTARDVKSILRVFKSTCVAELTKSHNIHYHAIVELEGLLDSDRLLNRLRMYRWAGKPHLLPVQYETSYEEYIQKDIKELSHLLGDTVIVDDFKIIIKNKYIDFAPEKIHNNVFRASCGSAVSVGRSKNVDMCFFDGAGPAAALAPLKSTPHWGGHREMYMERKIRDITKYDISNNIITEEFSDISV